VVLAWRALLAVRGLCAGTPSLRPATQKVLKRLTAELAQRVDAPGAIEARDRSALIEAADRSGSSKRQLEAADRSGRSKRQELATLHA
jgi:hypothetical protein